MKGPEVKKVEPGDGSLPRRIAVPLPGSEMQAMTPACLTILWSFISFMSSITTCLRRSLEEGLRC